MRIPVLLPVGLTLFSVDTSTFTTEPITHQNRLEATAVLERTQEILAQPEAWTQSALAKSASGRNVKTYSPKAVCYCLAGAVMAAGNYPKDISKSRSMVVAMDALLRAILHTDKSPARATSVRIIDWNDEKERTHQDVMEAVRKALVCLRNTEPQWLGE